MQKTPFFSAWGAGRKRRILYRYFPGRSGVIIRNQVDRCCLLLPASQGWRISSRRKKKKRKRQVKYLRFCMLEGVFCSLWVLTHRLRYPRDGINLKARSWDRFLFSTRILPYLSERSNVMHQEGYLSTVNLFEFSYVLPHYNCSFEMFVLSSFLHVRFNIPPWYQIGEVLLC